jgi:hypothetical protein
VVSEDLPILAEAVVSDVEPAFLDLPVAPGERQVPTTNRVEDQ